MAFEVVIALLALTVSTFTNSLGLILMKQALLKGEKTPEKSSIMRPRYIIGFLCLVAGAFVLVGALSYGDMITLSSTSSLTLVFNSLLSSKMLKEVFTRYDLMSIILISIGASLCVGFSDFSESKLSYEDLGSLYLSYQSFIFYALTIAYALFCVRIGNIIIKSVESFINKAKLRWQSLSLESQTLPETDQRTLMVFDRITQQFNDQPSDELTPIKQNELPARLLIKFIACLKPDEIYEIEPKFKRHLIRLPLFLYPWASGLLSSVTTSFIKGVSELVNSQNFVDNLQQPMIYILLLLVAVSLVSQLAFMNMSLKYYDQLEIVPIYQAAVILNNLLCGGVIFQEFDKYVWWKLLILCAGFIICVIGIMVVIKKNERVSQRSMSFDQLNNSFESRMEEQLIKTSK